MSKYIGNRYVPLHCGKWDITKEYESLSVVLAENGDSYTSIKNVPSQIPLEDTNFWVISGVFNEQLNTVKNQITINPDMFEGTDIEKLQKAYDYAINNDNVYCIELNRAYDLNDSSINMTKDSFKRWKNILFKGGCIIKNIEGYVFTCDEDYPSSIERQAPSFSNTYFLSTTGAYLYNGNQCKRQFLNNCTFEGMAIIDNAEYIQSLRVKSCEFIKQVKDTIKAKGIIDGLITDSQIEQTTSGTSFMNISENFSNLRILNNVIEGFTQSTPIKLPTGYGLKYEGNYHEANKGSIQITKYETGSVIIQGTIKNNTFGYNKTDYDIVFSDNIRLDRIYIENNFSNSKFMCNKYLVKNFDISNYMTIGKICPPYGASHYEKLKSLEVTRIDIDSGLGFEIPLNNLKYDGNLTLSGLKQYILTVKAQCGSSNIYSGHFVGILSIDGYSSKQNLSITPLSIRNLEGRTTGGTTSIPSDDSTSYFDYYFKETDTKEVDNGVDYVTIVLKFPKWINNAYAIATLKPLNDIVMETYINN